LGKRVSKEQEVGILVDYLVGNTSVAIGKRYGFSAMSVLNVVRRLGGSVRDSHTAAQKYRLDEEVFGSISEGSAYWAGFLMADGCVLRPGNSGSVIALGLSHIDRDHVEKFARFLKTDKPVREYKGNTTFGSSHSVGIRIYSDRIAYDLSKYGVLPNKSLTARVLQLENNRNFWRGVIDGDGCLMIGDDSCVIGLVGSEFLTNQFVSYVKTFVVTDTFPKKTESAAFGVRYSHRIAYAIIRKLYFGAEMFLDRKMRLANTIFDRFRCYEDDKIVVNSETKHWRHDLAGGGFGRLTVLERMPSKPNFAARWFCRCSCGNYKEVG